MKHPCTALILAVSLCLPIGAAIGTSGCAGNRYERSRGEYIDDKALSSRVNSALNDHQEFRFDDVNVTSFRGTVQLSGFVTSAAQKREAGEVAKNVKGVREVENNITVVE